MSKWRFLVPSGRYCYSSAARFARKKQCFGLEMAEPCVRRARDALTSLTTLLLRHHNQPYYTPFHPTAHYRREWSALIEQGDVWSFAGKLLWLWCVCLHLLH